MLIGIIVSSIFLLFVNGECPNGSIPYNSNCYIFNTTESGFSKAELSCIQIGGHLASIHDAFVNNLLGQEAPDKFQGSTETDFWIGNEKLQQNENWSWTDGTPFDFTDWNKGEPQNITGANCGALSITDGYWSAQDCFKSKPFVCEVDEKILPTYSPFINCSEGWVYFEPTHSCYGADVGGMHTNWTAAEEYCINKGAHLPSIHSFEEFRFIISYVYVYWWNLWLGLYSIDGQKTWKWSDNTQVDFVKWCSLTPQKYPGESYVAAASISAVGCYYDYNCTNCSFPTMCKKKANYF